MQTTVNYIKDGQEYEIPCKFRKQQRNSLAQQVKDLKLEPTSSVPMRRKAKDSNLDHSTFSLSR